MQMLVCLMLSQRSLKLSSFLFIPFLLFFLFISTTLSCSSPIYSSVLSDLLLISSSVFFISVIVFCISVWFFMLSNSLLNTSNFSFSTSNFLLSCLNIFTNITLNSLSSRLPASTLLHSSSVVLTCSFI